MKTLFNSEGQGGSKTTGTAADLDDIWDRELSRLHESGIIFHLDYYLAGAVARANPGVSSLARLSCALVSHALSGGQVSLDLKTMAGQELCPEAGEMSLNRLPDLETWVEDLKGSGCVGDEILEAEGEDSGWIAGKPLVLDRDYHLYLSKYYDFQVRLIRNMTERVSGHGTGLPEAFITKGLERYFSDKGSKDTAGQRLAVERALKGRFLVVSGGPGTGKTFVTAIIISLLEAWHLEQGLDRPEILSMAPTGKAAERLLNGRTIHSVLKPKSRGVGFVHGKDNPLHADMVIVDEASMIDMALMARLMEAVPLTTRLILLGDKNQLSPIQAGAVFTDLCAVKGLEKARAFLTVNFRSRGQSGIDALSRAVNQNDPKAVAQVLTESAYPEITFVDTGNKAFEPKVVTPYLVDGYRALAEAATAEKALEVLDNFRVLCAHTRGPAGTLQVNHLCEKLLPVSETDGITRSFFTQIVMATRNDYSRGLFNGDTGVVFRSGTTSRVYFREPEGARVFQLSQIPGHETAFAVTIHKSQGSEFDTVLILIPDRLSPVITRQLLYTGITRARSRVIIAGSLELICKAVTISPGQRSNLAAGLRRSLAKDTG